MRFELGSFALPSRTSCGLKTPAVLLAAGFLAGCGHTQQYAYPGTYPSSYVGARAVAAMPTAAEKVEMENDGLPAQAAPRAGIRQTPDDPREPWSRNYGGPAATSVRRADSDARVPAAPVPSAQGGSGGVTRRDVVGGYPVPVGPEPATQAYRPVAVAQQRWAATTR